MKNYLLITLGHNSSAIFVDNSSFEETGKSCIIGYEEERLSRIKADSQFPIDAINEIKYNVGLNRMKGCEILISHWFNFNGAETPNKYITLQDIDALKEISTNIKLVNKDFTHHDAHAYSAYEFRDYFKKQEGNIPVYCIVADGFGNNEEVLSIYRRDTGKKPELVKRFYGYEKSLGLFYQYATSFVGMKENQDEYKFLGYEAHIHEIFNDAEIRTLAEESDKIVEKFKNMYSPASDDAKTVFAGICGCGREINYAKLAETKENWHKLFADILFKIGFNLDGLKSSMAIIPKRTAIAFVVQRTVEKVINCIVASFGIKYLCLAGGLFYNVKLNNSILTSLIDVDGNLSIMPLAGDQGAVIGMYAAEEDTPQFPFRTLAIGIRRLYNIEKFADDKNIFVKQIPQTGDIESIKYLASEIANHIANGRIVNIVYGNMEFGPRALCNTSSVFLPNAELTAENNANNKRNEVMPCAPVCTPFAAANLFSKDELERVIGSLNFMICTLHYTKPHSNMYDGVMHNETLSVKYTGRPQIVHVDSFMHKLLSKVQSITDMKCLVNTSFNNHGNPIVFDTADIISNHKMQCERAIVNGTKKPILYVIKS